MMWPQKQKAVKSESSSGNMGSSKPRNDNNNCLFVPLSVQQVSGSDDALDQRVGPHRLLRRRLGAGVRVPALLVPHGLDVAAAPHPATGDLVVLAVPRVAAPLVLRHLVVEIWEVSWSLATTGGCQSGRCMVLKVVWPASTAIFIPQKLLFSCFALLSPATC